MTDLVDAVAKAIRTAIWGSDYEAAFWPKETDAAARAALAAIDQSGTHRVVPVEDQRTTVGDMDVVDWLLSAAEDPELEVYGFAMRSAAGEINRYREMLEARIAGEET